MRYPFLTSLLLALAAVFAAHGSTETAADTLHRQPMSLDSMQYLQNVVVYGRKPYSEVIPAQTLTGTRLERLASHSVADAVRYFAGVQMKDYGGVGGVKTIDLRSMGTNHLGVFYDGIQLGNAQNGQIDLGKFSLDNIEEISLYNGQKSEIFQPASDFGSAGTVYLKTRRPKFSDGKRFNFNVTMRTGSFGLANPSMRWEQKLSSNVSLTLNGEYTYATGQYHFRYRKRFSDGTVAWDTTALRCNGDLNAWRAEAALFGHYGTSSRWNAKIYYYDSERGIPGAIVNNVWYNSQRQWDRNFFAQGSWRTATDGDKVETMVNAKYARDYMRYLNPDTTLMLLDNKFWQQELYLSGAAKLKILDNWVASMSADYKWNYLDASLANFSRPTRHTALVAVATAITWQRFKAQGSLLYTSVNDLFGVYSGKTKLESKHKSLNKFTPAVFLSYKPLEEHDLNLRAFYKRIFRMPTFNDLYYTDVGNAQLSPEYVTQWNIGCHYQTLRRDSWLSGVKLTADAYYNHVTDKIIAVPQGRGQYRWMMMNIGEVRIAGIDLTAWATFRLAEGLNLDISANYTYQSARDYTDPDDNDDRGTYRGQIPYVPWHSGSVVGHLGWKKLDINYSFIYVGERYDNSANIRESHQQPWYTHDLGATYDFKLKRSHIKLTAEVNNLFNQYYDVIINYPMPGRNFKITVKYDF